MENKPHRLRVRLGNAEFDAEGDEATVKEQYKMFLDAVQRAPNIDQPVTRPQQEPAENFSEDPAIATTGLGQPDLERVFTTTQGVISLRVLPQGKTKDADALLLLLYGIQKLKHEHDALGTQIMKAARQSGLRIDRVDRVISTHRDFYIRGGRRRGARYSLNNQGIAKAEKILEEMFM